MRHINWVHTYYSLYCKTLSQDCLQSSALITQSQPIQQCSQVFLFIFTVYDTTLMCYGSVSTLCRV